MNTSGHKGFNLELETGSRIIWNFKLATKGENEGMGSHYNILKLELF